MENVFVLQITKKDKFKNSYFLNVKAVKSAEVFHKKVKRSFSTNQPGPVQVVKVFSSTALKNFEKSLTMPKKN